jgi:hypothetical protein
LQRFHANRQAFEQYDPTNAASADAAFAGLANIFSLNGNKNIEGVHWLITVGVIPKKLSAKMANIRNDMVRIVCHEMADQYGELHRIDFSPATNLFSDIDQTFRAIDPLPET